MWTRNFLPQAQVMYSPDFESSGGDNKLDFEGEGLDGPTGEDFENNDNAEMVPDLEFEPDEDGNQNFKDDSELPGNFPEENDSDGKAGDEPNSTGSDGDEKNPADGADTERSDINSLYLRAGQLGVSSEEVAQFADKGPDALNAYLSGLEAGGTGQQEDGEGKATGNSQPTSFDIEPFNIDFGDEESEFDETLIKNLKDLTEHTNKGLEQVMQVATGLATEIIELINSQNEDSMAENNQSKKNEKTTATLKSRKMASFAKAQKKTSKAERGLSPRQRAAAAIEENYPGEFGE